MTRSTYSGVARVTCLSLLFVAPSSFAGLIFSEDFNAGIPLSWSVTDSEGNGLVWTTNDATGENNNTGGAGLAAVASSDAFGPAEFDTLLESPTIDLSGYSSASVSYLANYQNFGFLDFLDFQVSIDGGATWDVLLSWNEDHGSFNSPPGELVTIDISSYISPQTSLGWRYYDPNDDDFDWYAQIDNVEVTARGAVPTPATLALLGLGLVGLRLRRKA